MQLPVIGSRLTAFQGRGTMKPVENRAAMAPESPSTPGTAKHSVDAFAVIRELAGSIEAPSDFAAEHDHYIYGTPKRDGCGE